MLLAKRRTEVPFTVILNIYLISTAKMKRSTLQNEVSLVGLNGAAKIMIVRFPKHFLKHSCALKGIVKAASLKYMNYSRNVYSLP